MRNISSCLAAALIVVLVTSYGHAESGPKPVGDQSKSPEQASPADNRSDDAALRIRIVEPPEEAKARERREAVSAQNEKEDLEAQKGMAVSAAYAMYFTGLQLILSIGGFAGLFYTLYLTRAATRVAEESNEINRATAKRQMRAYLSMRANTLVRRTGDVTGLVEMINSGQTPAELLGYSCRVISDKAWPQDAPEFGHFREHRMSIGPGITNRFSVQEHLPWSAQRDQELATCGISLRLYGYVRYLDIFGDEHTTYFSHIICGEGQIVDAPMNIDKYGRNDAD